MDFPVKTVEQLRDQLRSLRRAAELTQHSLGVRLDLGQARVASIEAGPGSVSTVQLLKILQALDAELVIRPKSKKRIEPRAAVGQTSKATAARAVESAKVPDEVTQVAQGRLRDLLHMSIDQTQEVMRLVKWRGNPPGDNLGGNFPRTQPVLLDAQSARELDYWRQALDVDRETFLKTLRAVGVVLVHDTPSRNEGSW